jgi:hypothetical protein
MPSLLPPRIVIRVARPLARDALIWCPAALSAFAGSRNAAKKSWTPGQARSDGELALWVAGPVTEAEIVAALHGAHDFARWL